MAAWFAAVDDDELFLSVFVIGELQRGSDRIRRRAPKAANSLDRWLGNILATYADRILPIDLAVARLWGSFGVSDPSPTVDGLLAATAVHHELVLATRNAKDVASTGVAHVNPFEERITTGPRSPR
ncbi:MAG TPA: type II toxin-antitoxin system VapC family toxin [Polyangiales bacterium]|nr:type II toxin-antitoxin system VapC family toxin [Polyangiales bacterium]